jgi:hypothetical protein
LPAKVFLLRVVVAKPPITPTTATVNLVLRADQFKSVSSFSGLEPSTLFTRFGEVEHNAGEMNRPTPLVFFSICGVVDFVFGLVKWHLVVAGIVAIVCGLPLTVLLFLGFRASWKGNDDSGAPGS